jgi:hypothetical protein
MLKEVNKQSHHTQFREQVKFLRSNHFSHHFQCLPRYQEFHFVCLEERVITACVSHYIFLAVSQCPKGTNQWIASMQRLLSDERVPSLSSLERGVKSCKVPLNNCQLMQPIINQHWNCKRGQHRLASSLDMRTGHLFFDLRPIKVNVITSTLNIRNWVLVSRL